MKLPLLILFILPISIKVQGQNCGCSELLKYGLYNHFSQNYKIDNYSKVTSSINTQLEKVDNKAGGGEATYGLFGGKYNASQAASLKKLSSSNNLSEQENNEILNTSSSFISPEMVSAYKHCLDLCNNSGLKFKVDIPTDNFAKIVAFTLSYDKKQFVTRQPKIRKISVTPENSYSISGSMLDLMRDSTLLNPSETYTLICTRKIEPIEFLKTGTKDIFLFAEESFFNIETDMGVYQFRVPPIYAKPELTAGVGEIVSSMLDTATFYRVYGIDWVLADGRTAPEGSRYKLLVKELVPDLRGRFLRGFNNGELINPDNNNLGEEQKDAFQGHHHVMGGKVIAPPNPTENQGDYLVTSKRGSKQELDIKADWSMKMNIKSPITDGKNGEVKVASETRPQNVTVNYFIKIN